MPNNLLTTKFEIFIGNTWEDYTDGLLNANIIRGVQNAYQGPWQQPESGVMTIVSRNAQLDPHVNADFRLGKTVRVTHDDVTLFTGRINSINVDYQPKGEPSITTLTAVDMLGTMALHTLRDTFKDRLGSTMSMIGFNQELEITGGLDSSNPASEIFGYSGTVNSTSGNGDATNARDGISALEMFTKLAQTNLDFFYADKNNEVQIYNNINAKKDEVQKLQFDSRGGATSYSTINLTDGFDLLKNKIVIDNGQGVTIPTYTNSYSIEEWGSQSATISTYFTTPGQSSYTDQLAEDIFKETVYPTREIDTITFDATHAPDAIEDIDILDNVYVYHEVDGFDISKKYGIIGISHNITRDSWDITYKLRNMFIYNELYKTPVISITPSTGTIDTTFTFGISNTSELFMDNATYLWDFGDGYPTSTLANPTHKYNLSAVGTRTITLTFTNAYGFTTEATTTLLIAGAAPTNVSFTYTVSSPDTSIINFVGSEPVNSSSILWDFGDGTTSVQRVVSHKYATSGNKTVIYKAINAYGQTTSTQVINVTVPVGPTNEVGTWPVRWIRIGLNGYSAPSGYVWPLMSQLKALTSYTNTNKAPSCIIEHSQNYKLSPTETLGAQVWKGRSGNDANVYNNGESSSITLSASLGTGSGIQPYMNITGTTNWSLIIDLLDVNYDIKKFALTFGGGGSAWTAPNAPTTLDVYITDYTGETRPIDNVTWTKAGTINRTTGVFTPSITMPANLP